MLQRVLCALTVLVLCASTLTAHAALEEYTEAPSFDHFSPTSQPWETVLPKEFSPDLFLKKGQKFLPGELSTFILRAHLPRSGTGRAVSLAPLPLGTYQPPVLGVRFEAEEAYTPEQNDLRFVPHFFTHGSKSMVTALNQGRFAAISQGDFQKAAVARTDNTPVAIPAGYTVQQFRKDCAMLYKIYRTQQKIGFSYLVMDWDAQQERFVIVGKIQAEPLTFQQFLKVMPFWAPKD